MPSGSLGVHTVQGEPNRPLPTVVAIHPAGDPETADPDGGDHLDPIGLLRGLDQILGRRATAIEAELREISLVRECIKGHLSVQVNGAAKAPRCPGAGGASLGQMI